MICVEQWQWAYTCKGDVYETRNWSKIFLVKSLRKNALEE
jgi:hypothetical protein